MKVACITVREIKTTTYGIYFLVNDVGSWPLWKSSSSGSHHEPDPPSPPSDGGGPSHEIGT